MGEYETDGDGIEVGDGIAVADAVGFGDIGDAVVGADGDSATSLVARGPQPDASSSSTSTKANTPAGSNPRTVPGVFMAKAAER